MNALGSQKPSQVQGLKAASKSSSQLDLVWNVNPGIEKINHYNIYRNTASGFTVNNLTDRHFSSTTNSYNDVGLNASTTYYYRVVAVNGSGQSGEPSDIASAMTQPQPPAKAMSTWLRTVLILFLSSIIFASVYFLIITWHPGQGSVNFNNLTHSVITGPTKNTTITTLINQTTETINITTTLGKQPNITKISNISVAPIPSHAFINEPILMFTNKEIRLVIVAALFGLMGASVHGLASITAWLSRQKLTEGWGWWYFVRPFIGAAMAVMTYLVIRAGFIQGGPSVVDDFAVAAIAALTGLMTDEITKKLRDVLDTLFGIDKPDTEKGENPKK